MMNNKRVTWLVVVVSALMGSAAALLAVVVVFLFVEPGGALTDYLAVARKLSDDPVKKVELTEAEETEQVIAWKEMQMLKFNSEDLAPIWAEQTQNQLIERFQLLNNLRVQNNFKAFQVDNVECHSSMCVAMLRWDNIELARDASPVIAGFNYQLPCATSSLIYADPEKIEDVNYRHEVIFRCKKDLA